MRQGRGASEEASSWLPPAMRDGLAQEPASAGEGIELLAADELPTMPPPPGRDPGWLRWAGETAESGPSQDAALSARQPLVGEPGSGGLPPMGAPAPAGDGPSSQDASAGRRARSLVLVIVTVLVATGLVAAGVLIGLQLGGGRSAKQVSGGVATFEKLLSTSDQARALTRRALAGACKTSAPGTPARQALVLQLTRAAGLDRRAAGLEQRSIELSNEAGDQRRQALWLLLGAQAVTADRASISAIDDYQGWFVDLQATGCYGGPTNDLHYQAGLVASEQARRAWQRVASSWAYVARYYKLPRWEPT